MDAEPGPNDRVNLSIDGDVAELRLADPDRRNAFSPALGEDLLTHMLVIDDHDEISVVVLTSEGEVFCAGLDLDVLRGDDPEARNYMFELLGAVIEWLYWGSLPVVVGAHGPAPGGGSIIMDACDIRVAGEDISMWWPEVAFGIPGHTIAARLVSQVGWPKATELMLLGNESPTGAQEAKEIGLANRVVPPEEVDPTAREIAEIIADHDRQHANVRSHLEAIHHAREELQGASQAYAGWLARDLQRLLDG